MEGRMGLRRRTRTGLERRHMAGRTGLEGRLCMGQERRQAQGRRAEHCKAQGSIRRGLALAPRRRGLVFCRTHHPPRRPGLHPQAS